MMLSSLRVLMCQTDVSGWITRQGSFPLRKQILPFQKSLMACVSLSEVDTCPVSPLMLTYQLLHYIGLICAAILLRFVGNSFSTISRAQNPVVESQHFFTFVEQIGTNMAK